MYPYLWFPRNLEFLQESHEVKRKKLKPGAGWGVGMGVGAFLPADFTQLSQPVRPPYRGTRSPMMIGGIHHEYNCLPNLFKTKIQLRILKIDLEHEGSLGFFFHLPIVAMVTTSPFSAL